jgi:hypothetical protein
VATPTVGRLAERLVSEVAPEELPTFELISDTFYTRPEVRDSTAANLLRGPRPGRPAGLDPESVALVTQVVLLILGAIVSDRFVKQLGRYLRGARTWLGQRRLRRAIRSAQTPNWPDTPLPKLSATHIREVGDLVRWVAVRAGLTPEVANRLANLVVAALTEPLPPE